MKPTTPNEALLQAVDPYAPALTFIDHIHRQVHEGNVFHASKKVTGVINGGTSDILLSVPAALFPHVTRVLYNVGAGDIDIVAYEGTTTSADGTTVTPINLNRNSTKTASLALFTGPTVTGVGTEMHPIWVPPSGAGVGNQAGVIGITPGEEWILKPSTKYLLRLTNNSGGTISYSVDCIHYEL